MAVNVDLICSKCSEIRRDKWSDEEGKQHGACSGVWERLWTTSDRSAPMCHPSEACVVYVSEAEGGKIQYPGRNDEPVPARLRARGYEKLTMSPRQVAQFERKHNVINERLNYNRNGRGAENQ